MVELRLCVLRFGLILAPELHFLVYVVVIVVLGLHACLECGDLVLDLHLLGAKRIDDGFDEVSFLCHELFDFLALDWDSSALLHRFFFLLLDAKFADERLFVILLVDLFVYAIQLCLL